MSISSLFYTLLSVLEVLLVVVPSLMVVAFITLAERKTMASMQRRIGPNFVGQLKLNLSFKRPYHSSSYDKAIDALYRNRKAPVKPFEEKVVSVCKDLLSSTALSTFFKNLKGNKPYLYLKSLKCFGLLSKKVNVRYYSSLNHGKDWEEFVE
jgi:hypothetical protein